MRKILMASALVTALAGLPAVAHAESAYGVTIQGSTSTVTVGHRVVLTGSVSPAASAAGRFVRLEERFAPGKPWRLQRRARVASDGHYRVGDRPTTNTLHRYRVVIPGGGDGHAAGVSDVVRVRVYSWTNLTSLRRANSAGVYEPRRVWMNGVAYAPGIASYRPGQRPAHVEYELRYDCTQLRATFGLDDSSEIDGQTEVTVRTEQGQLYSRRFSVGQTDQETLQLGSPLKVRIEMTSLVDGVQGYGAVGAARVLCTR
jgi:hypothetical protein